MSKIYNSMELSKALNVHPSTITYWVENGQLHGVKEASGKMIFTEEQVMNCLIKKQLHPGVQHNSTLYIIDAADENEFESMVKTAYDVQKQTSPESIFIENISTFLSSQKENSLEVKNATLKKYEKKLKAEIIKEVSKQVKKYLYNKVQYLSELDDRYEVLTLAELKSLVLGDADDELVKKFDSIFQSIKENPNANEVNADGTLNLTHAINAATLNMFLRTRLSDIAKATGIADERFLQCNVRQLLGYSKLIDKDTCDLLASKDLKIDYNSDFITKILNSVKVQEKNEGIMAKVQALVKQGYYNIAKYYPHDDGNYQYIYNLLDSDNFKKVVYLGKSPLAEPIAYKINSQVSKGQIDYLPLEPSNLNKYEEN